MTTPLPTGDPARGALELSDEILARLDAATAQSAVGESEHTERSASIPTIEERLRIIDDRIAAALDAGDTGAVRQLVEEAKALTRAERAVREKSLGDAEDYFNETLKEYGEQGDETQKASAAVNEWKSNLSAYDAFISKMDTYYDEIVSGMEIDDGRVASPVRPGVVEKYTQQTLEELLATLDKAEATYSARLQELKAEKQDVAARLVEERIAKLKASITPAS